MKKNFNKINVFISVIFVLLLFFSFCPVFSEDVQVEGYEYRLDIPENWELLDAENLSFISFTDPTHSIVLQIIVYPGEKYFKATDIADSIKSQLNAQGEGENFVFNMKNSYIADLVFKANKYTARGYFIFINGQKYDYAVFSYTSQELYEGYKAFILSALDSFSLNKEGLLYPGPVSQYFYPFPAPETKAVDIIFQDKKLSVNLDNNELEASQIVIEREAIVLSTYENNRPKAWERFYRMIYRDNYHRLDNIFNAIDNELENKKLNKQDKISFILKWLQDFSYTSTGTLLSDIHSPLASCINHSGDCDSRALIFLSLLCKLDIDSILLVSSKYKHSAVGINSSMLNRKGAMISFEDKKYLYAELTSKVDIGLIASDYADPSGWQAIRLGSLD